MPKTGGTCQRCGGKMAEGFLLDEAHACQFAVRWVAGRPEPRWFRGIKPGSGTQYRVEADRCDACGWLDLYAVKRDF